MSEMQVYRFEDVEVDLARNCLVRDGGEVHLRQKTFQVLVHLIENRERLVSKDELFNTVWHETSVTDDVLVQCVKEIRRALGDEPHNPRYIKTVPKAGYRFIGANENGANGSYTEDITRVEIEYEEQNETTIEASSQVGKRSLSTLSFGRRYAYLAGASLAVAVVAFAYFGIRTQGGESNAGRKTIAVMYFDNQSESSELNWLREGLADMVASGLARSEKLTVLGRGQLASWLKRTGADEERPSFERAHATAKSAKADIFAVGSFAKIGERIRVDVQLHDTATGEMRASETLTVEQTEQLLTSIDLLSLKIASRIGGSSPDMPDLATTMTDNLEAYRHYSVAVEKAHAMQAVEAIDLLKKAVELDPEFAMAHARIGYVYAVTWAKTAEGRPYLEKAFQLSLRLSEKDRMSIIAWYALANTDYAAAIEAYRGIVAHYPLETEGYLRLARVLDGESRSDEAVEILNRGLAVDPDAKEMLNALGGIYSRSGRHAEAIATHEKYVALAPGEANAYDSLGLSLQWAGEYERAVESYNQALRINPQFEIALVHLGNTRIRQGRYSEAASAYDRYIEMAPSNVERARGLEAIAYIHLMTGDLARARSTEAEATRLWGANTGLAHDISSRSGDLETARRVAESIVTRGSVPGRGSRVNRVDSYYRAQVALADGNAEQANALLRETIAQSPIVWSYRDYEDALAMALADQGRLDEAIEEYLRILQRSPNYPLARYRLAQAYEATGARDRAREQYAAFLEEWRSADAKVPEITSARKAIARL